MNQDRASGIMRLRASPLLAAWVGGTSLGALVLLSWYLPVAAALAAGCVVLLHAWQMLRLQALRRHPEAVIALQVRGDTLSYQLRAGDWCSGTIPAGGLVTRWISVTRLREIGETPRHRTLVLCADALDADDYRRLRVYLRWGWRDPARTADPTI